MLHLNPNTADITVSHNHRREPAKRLNSVLLADLINDDVNPIHSISIPQLATVASMKTAGKLFTYEATGEDRTFRELFDQNPLPMCVFDEDTKKILFANTIALQRYGYSKREMTQKTVFDLYIPDEQERLFRWAANRNNSLSGSMGYWRHQTKNGTVLSVEVFRETLKWSGRSVCLYVLPDVTEQVRGWHERLTYQEALTRSEDLTRRSANNLLHILGEVSDGFLTLDANGRFTFISSGAEKLLATTSDMLGRTLSCLFDDTQVQPLIMACNRAMQDGISVKMETCLPIQGRWLEATICPLPRTESAELEPGDSPATLAVVFRDIHQQKEHLRQVEKEKAEHHRQEQERRHIFSEMLGAVSGGKLRFCETAFDLPTPLAPWGEPVSLSDSSALATLRQAVREAAFTCGFSLDRSHDLVAGAGEAAINALLYGDDTAHAEILVSPDRSRIQIWVVDHGHGIPLSVLPQETLARGRGFSIMIDCTDTVHLWTGQQGTTIVLEVTREGGEHH